MAAVPQPTHLSKAVSELITRRGLARVDARVQLASIWKKVAGDKIAAQTRVLGIRRGVLEIGVPNAVLLAELVGFHRTSLLSTLKRTNVELNISGIKFQLRSEPLKPTKESEVGGRE